MTGPRRTTVRRTALLALGALALPLAAACEPGDGASGDDSTPAGPPGQLTLLAQGPTLAWDPQRISSRQSAGFAARTYMRTLTTYATGPDSTAQQELVPDLATTTGKASKDLRTWTFTLRQGVTWQDGSPVTCADLRHGVARALDRSTGAGGYALTYLDIPKKPDGTSTYPGPYLSGAKAKAADKLLARAVECDGRKITYRLGSPAADFDQVVSLPEFAPFTKSKDQRDKSTYEVFSSGPYQLEKGWTPSQGGTWVRNPQWSQESDPVRTPGPERIVHQEGIEPQAAVADILDADDGARMMTLEPVPAAVSGAVTDAGDQLQSIAVPGQLVDFLAPNHKSPVLKKAAARVALATATDRAAYVEALGGPAAGAPTWSLLTEALPSSHDPVLDAGPSGDPVKAATLLAEAKVKDPSLRVAYRSTPEMDKAMGALKVGWEKAGFRITLVPVTDDYFTTVSTVSEVKDLDLVWANWGPDYPSAATVLPLLFDDRINLTDRSTGRDYGQVADKELNAAMDKAARTPEAGARATAWAEVDKTLLERGSYIPLMQDVSLYVAGRDVTTPTGNTVFGGIVDLGSVGVSR